MSAESRNLPAGAVVLAVLLAGCGSENVRPVPDSIEKIPGGDAQASVVGAILQEPFAVRVLTSDGAPAMRTRVRWVLRTGTGTLSDSVTLVDGLGRAEVSYRIGVIGAHVVRAEIADNAALFVDFTATATEPPAIATVVPALLAGQDTFVITGARLESVDRVEVAGRPGRILARSTSSVTAVAPPCLDAGSRSVVVYQGAAASLGFNVTTASDVAPISLAVGEHVSIPAQSSTACAVFAAAPQGGADYLVTAQSHTSTPGLSAPYVMSGMEELTAAPPAAALEPQTFAQRFHDLLRGAEVEIARSPKEAGGDGPMVSAMVDIGDRRDFRVCDKVGCSNEADFARVRAEVKFVGDNVILYQDVAAPGGGFTDAQLSALGTQMDDDLYVVDTEAFGAESDVDGNGRVAVLMTPVVNGITPEGQCGVSIVTGFFFGIDIDPGFRSDARSNQGEVFYTLSPDPTGAAGCPVSEASVLQLAPVTFVHELQHMISYNQHVLLRRGDPEVLWLNEGLSHLAEELAAFRFLERGDQASFSRFASGDLLNAYQYLQSTVSHFLLAGQGTGSLEERGSAWLFTRWLLDHFGDGLSRRLVETDRTGAANVEAVTGMPFDQLLTEWFFAAWVSDFVSLPAQGRLQYLTWDFRELFADLSQQAPALFPRAFPIVPANIASSAFSIAGTLRAGSGSYSLLTHLDGAAPFRMMLSGSGGGAIDPAVVARINILRLR